MRPRPVGTSPGPQMATLDTCESAEESRRLRCKKVIRKIQMRRLVRIFVPAQRKHSKHMSTTAQSLQSQTTHLPHPRNASAATLMSKYPSALMRKSSSRMMSIDSASKPSTPLALPHPSVSSARLRHQAKPMPILGLASTLTLDADFTLFLPKKSMMAGICIRKVEGQAAMSRVSGQHHQARQLSTLADIGCIRRTRRFGRVIASRCRIRQRHGTEVKK
jgi:hypothetical protein